MERDLFCFCVQADRKLRSFYYGLYRVRLAVVVNKSGFVRPET